MSTSRAAGGPVDRSPAIVLKSLLAQALGLVRGGDERRRTQRDALVAFAVRVASAGILYLTQVALARWMGSFDYGIYVFVWTWVLVLGGLASLGLNHAVMRFVPEYRALGDLERLRGILSSSRHVTLGVGTAIAALGGFGLWLAGPLVSTHYVLPAYLALVCVPFFALTDLQDGIGRGRSWMGIALIPPYILRPVLVLAGMGIAHAAGWATDARTAVAAAIGATWAAWACQTLFLERRLAREMPRGPASRHVRTWLAVAAPLLVISACELVFQNADLLVISAYMSPSDVGIYFAAAKTMSLVMFVHYAVGSAAAHRFAALNAAGEKEKLRAFVADAVNWTFWPSLAGAVLILLLGRPLLYLFGPQFEAGYPAMFILVLGFLARAAMGPSEFMLKMLGEQTLCAAVHVATAALDVVLLFALVPRFGLTGAAAGTSIALISAAGLNYLVAKRRLEIEIAIWSNLPRFQRA